VLGLCGAIAIFIALWVGIGWALFDARLFDNGLFDAAIKFLGGLAVAFLTWLLFPSIVTLVLGFFIDGVLGAIEARRYPGARAATRQSWGEILAASLRLTLLTIVLNLLALPLYIFVPGVNLVLFYGSTAIFWAANISPWWRCGGSIHGAADAVAQG